MIVIGLMSGTSLDGLDIAAVNFKSTEGKFSFELLKTTVIEYSAEWRERLHNAVDLNGKELVELDVNYGKWLGKQVKNFVDELELKPDLIGSHGHTVFHEPQKGFTLQIGNANYIKAECGINVVSDFRSLDIALGGQGAPLAPIGDQWLFSDYESCLNLGGIANISFTENGLRRAFDVCPCNLVLNELAAKEGLNYDKGGQLAAAGEINNKALSALNSHAYYQVQKPKSLDKSEVMAEFLPLLDKLQVKDALRTFTEHVAEQIASVKMGNKLLITGGGAFNEFLVERIKAMTPTQVIIPENEIVEFKEAIIFAFLAYLRSKGKTNCLKSVTGAKTDSCSGLIL